MTRLDRLLARLRLWHVLALFALLALNYLAAQLVFALVPMPRVGAPVGPLVNLLLFVVMLVGLGLSLWRRDSVAQERRAG